MLAVLCALAVSASANEAYQQGMRYFDQAMFEQAVGPLKQALNGKLSTAETKKARLALAQACFYVQDLGCAKSQILRLQKMKATIDRRLLPPDFLAYYESIVPPPPPEPAPPAPPPPVPPEPPLEKKETAVAKPGKKRGGAGKKDEGHASADGKAPADPRGAPRDARAAGDARGATGDARGATGDARGAAGDGHDGGSSPDAPAVVTPAPGPTDTVALIPWYLRLFPFGISHFLQKEWLFGALFLTVEAALVATNVALAVVNELRVQPDGRLPGGSQSASMYWAQQGTAIAAYAVFAFGLVDGLFLMPLRHKPAPVSVGPGPGAGIGIAGSF